MTPPEVDVAGLAQMTLGELRAVWEERFGAPPRLRSPELLALMLGWRLQAETHGGLAPETRRLLRRPPATGARESAMPGTRVTREWKGVRHEVSVLGPGQYLYQDERYASLSQIARRITGSRWNGPRFFGLRGEAAR